MFLAIKGPAIESFVNFVRRLACTGLAWTVVPHASIRAWVEEADHSVRETVGLFAVDPVDVDVGSVDVRHFWSMTCETLGSFQRRSLIVFRRWGINSEQYDRSGLFSLG